MLIITLIHHHHQFIILENFPHQWWLASPLTALLLQPSLFHVSCCTTPLFFMSSSTMSIHRFTGLPLFLCPSIFSSNTLYLHLLITSYNMSEPPQSFCLKCSSKSSTPTFDAIIVLSTLSFNVTLQINLSNYECTTILNIV